MAVSTFADDRFIIREQSDIVKSSNELRRNAGLPVFCRHHPTHLILVPSLRIYYDYSKRHGVEQDFEKWYLGTTLTFSHEKRGETYLTSKYLPDMFR